MKGFLKKSAIFILLFCFFLFSLNIGCFADTMDTSVFEKDNPIENSTKSIGETIVGVLRIVGATVAIVMLLVIAMKYMYSAPGDRADIKKHAIAYVIGAVILFGVSGILGILLEVAESINAN